MLNYFVHDKIIHKAMQSSEYKPVGDGVFKAPKWRAIVLFKWEVFNALSDIFVRACVCTYIYTYIYTRKYIYIRKYINVRIRI